MFEHKLSLTFINTFVTFRPKAVLFVGLVVSMEAAENVPLSPGRSRVQAPHGKLFCGCIRDMYSLPLLVHLSSKFFLPLTTTFLFLCSLLECPRCSRHTRPRHHKAPQGTTRPRFRPALIWMALSSLWRCTQVVPIPWIKLWADRVGGRMFPGRAQKEKLRKPQVTLLTSNTFKGKGWEPQALLYFYIR